MKTKYVEKIAYIEESLKSAHKRIDKTDVLAQTVSGIASNSEAMQRDITDIYARIKTIEEKPARRWELMVSAVITTLVGVLIGYFFA